MLSETENMMSWILSWFEKTSLNYELSLFLSRIIILAFILLLAVIADYICRYFIVTYFFPFDKAGFFYN